MDILRNDTELNAITRSYNVNDDGNPRTVFQDTYISFGGIRKFIQRKDARREKRIDDRTAARVAKKTGTAERRAGRGAFLKSKGEGLKGDAAAMLAAVNAPQAPAPKTPKSSNKNILIGLGIAVAVVGAFLLLKKKNKP